MIFRLYTAAAGGAPLWDEHWTGSNSVQVSDGLFNVMLGSVSAIPESVVTGSSNLWLGITVGSDDEMVPRVQLGSVPFAVQAVTVPNGSVSTTKLADAAVTTAKVGDGAITSAKLGSSLTIAEKLTLGAVDQGYKFQVWASADTDGVARIGYYDYGGNTVLSVAPGNVEYDAPGSVGGRMTILGSNGYVGFGNANPGYPLHMGSGAHVTAGGSWTNASDRNAKREFAPADTAAILARVEELPIQTWSYKSESASVRHVGPTAQDFAAAFDVGDDDRFIGTVDADGVALAAIQALSRRVNEQAMVLEELRVGSCAGGE
jgi:hypothetical protein